MKITYSWLKDFVDIKLSVQELSELLTRIGLEVVSFKKNKDDWVIELEVTPNRSDCLSVVGIAREVSAITGKKLKLRQHGLRKTDLRIKVEKGKNQDLRIEVENIQDCPLYTAGIIKDVKVKPSPPWLKERLEAVGLRSINNIVDITNYVQLSLGQPLHAFDLDKIKDNLISVRRAKDGEEIITIDGQKFSLDKNILVIADSQRPVAVAGIMGSQYTEVDFDTKNILLESAKFNPILIRRMRRQMGLVSESQYRFERDVDVNNVMVASDYAMRLIEKICNGKRVFFKKVGILPRRRKIISFNIDNVGKVLGESPYKKRIVSILKRLGFKIKQIRKNINVEVPSFRKDIKEQIDLIEEIARIWGYERIPLSLPHIMVSGEKDNALRIIQKIRSILIGQGFFEVINYSLISKQTLNKLKIDRQDSITIANPLSSQQEVLRPLLLDGLLSCVSKNIRHREGVLFFEIGKVFSERRESNSLGLVLCGKRIFFKDTGKIEDNLGILHLKGTIELILENMGIKNFDFLKTKESYLEYALKIVVEGKHIGYLGKVDSEVVENFDISKKEVFTAQMNLDTLMNFVSFDKRYQPLPVYPVARRDISIIVKEEISAKQILDRINPKNFPLLRQIKVIDFYKGAQIPSGFKSITFGCFYYSDTHTLTEEEINSEHNRIGEILKQEFSAQLR